jgi:hypothetical protein
MTAGAADGLALLPGSRCEPGTISMMPFVLPSTTSSAAFARSRPGQHARSPTSIGDGPANGQRPNAKTPTHQMDGISPVDTLNGASLCRLETSRSVIRPGSSAM